MSAVLLQKGLVVAYFVIAGAYALETNWARCCYFLSAAAITVSVLFMD